MEEIFSLISNYSIQIVITGLFLFYVNDNRTYTRKREIELEKNRQEQMNTFTSILNDKQKANDSLLAQIMVSNENLAKSQNNIAESLKIIQKSNEQIGHDIREHRSNMRDYINEERRGRK